MMTTYKQKAPTHKTDETPERYDAEAEVAEAMTMLGTGYEQPSVVVEPPRLRTERRGRRMVQVEEPAFVKFSTDFKNELAGLDVYALKVFIYIGLSINFETETAFPGIRKIASDTGMNKDTVAKAVEELEEKDFLKVWRRDGAGNIYKPTSYFAIGETVPRGRTVPELSGLPAKLSGAECKLSDENAKLSDASRVNRTQLDKQEETRTTETGVSSQINPNTGRRTAAKVRGDLADAALFFGRQAVEQGEDKVEEVIANLEREFRANFPRSPKMQGIARFILGKEKDGQTLVTFAAWARRDEFNASRLYEYAEQPEKIRTRWPQAFVKQDVIADPYAPKRHKL